MGTKMRVAKADDERIHTGLYGTPVTHSVAASCFDIIYPSLGLPRHTFKSLDCPSVDAEDSIWRQNKARPDFLGSCMTMPLKLAVIKYLDELTPTAKGVGSVNVTYWEDSDGSDGHLKHVGTNVDCTGVENALIGGITGTWSPFPHGFPTSFEPGNAAGLVVGGGGAARAAIWALKRMNVGPILLVNRDAEELYAVVQQFPALDIRPIATPHVAEITLRQLDMEGIALCVGVGAIPSVEPKTEAEKMVYATLDALLVHPYAASSTHQSRKEVVARDYLPLPRKPCYLDMAYKPPMTTSRTMAARAGWTTVCGVEVVAEICFEMANIWTGLTVDERTREEVRTMLREREG